MTTDELVRYLPEHIKPLAEQLRQFPTGYEKWVYATAAPPETYQGDVFASVTIVSVDEDGDAILGTTAGMVISNTCDAQPGMADFILVAPVISLADYRENSALEGENLENHISALRDNRISQLIFLPPRVGLADSFADLGNICPISSTYFHSRHAQARLVSLSQYGHYFLLIKLAYHLTRPEPSDAKRT